MRKTKQSVANSIDGDKKNIPTILQRFTLSSIIQWMTPKMWPELVVRSRKK